MMLLMAGPTAESDWTHEEHIVHVRALDSEAIIELETEALERIKAHIREHHPHADLDEMDAMTARFSRMPMPPTPLPPRPISVTQFLADHPEADADGDGDISRSEHDAYLVAVALSDEAAVLEAFPHADRDDDGALSEQEASRLVGVCLIQHAMPQAAGVWIPDPDSAPLPLPPARIRAQVNDQTSVILSSQPPDGSLKNVSDWLMDNIAYRPDADEVAELIEVVEQAPLAAFLERHPIADTDEDGALTEEELATFLRDHLGFEIIPEGEPRFDVIRIPGLPHRLERPATHYRVEFITEDDRHIVIETPGEHNVWVEEVEEE